MSELLTNKSDYSSVDPNEVAHYNRLSGLWWDAQGPFWPLHRLNKLRVVFLRDAICQHYGRNPHNPKPLKDLRILDIGCGGGILSESIAQLGGSVHGIDVTEGNIHIARQHALQQGLKIDYDITTAEAMARDSMQYDVVCNMEVVEHVADLPGFVHACNQLVRPGGLMFIATINRTLISWLFAIIGAEYILRWLPRGTHQWLRFPKPVELERLLSQDGLSIIDRKGVRVNPFTRRFTLSNYLGVNYMLVSRKASTQPHEAEKR